MLDAWNRSPSSCGCPTVTDARPSSWRGARVKYARYGYAVKPEEYAAGVWGLRPAVVLAWDRLNIDATRFVFPPLH
jgi:hypothetical protein